MDDLLALIMKLSFENALFDHIEYEAGYLTLHSGFPFGIPNGHAANVTASNVRMVRTRD